MDEVANATPIVQIDKNQNTFFMESSSLFPCEVQTKGAHGYRNSTPMCGISSGSPLAALSGRRES
jgi:hypothetical protein